MMVLSHPGMDVIDCVLRASRPIDRVPYAQESFDRINEAVTSLVIYSDDEEPVALMGLSLYAEPHLRNIGHAWAIFTDDARGLGLKLARLAKRTLAMDMVEHELDRVITFTQDEAVENRRWLSVIGFKAMVGAAEVTFDADGLVWRGYELWASKKYLAPF